MYQTQEIAMNSTFYLRPYSLGNMSICRLTEGISRDKDLSDRSCDLSEVTV